MLRLCSLSALTAALTLLTPRAALAHLHLRGAQPAAGARLTAVPTQIRLTFSEPPQLALSFVELTAPDGSVVPLGVLAIDSAARSTLSAAITGTLTAGTYTVVWSTASADGHPVRGRYTFAVVPGATGPAASTTAPAAPRADSATTAAPDVGPSPAPAPSVSAQQSEAPRFDVDSPLYAAIRWLGYAALLGFVGSVVFALVIAPRAAIRLAGHVKLPADTHDASRAAAHVGYGAAVLLVVAALARLVAQSYAVHGAHDAWRASLLGSMLTHTVWGWGWMLEAAAALLALAAMMLALRANRAGWLLGALASVGLALSFALSGHAVAVPQLAPLAVLADALHVLGAGGWLGTLLVVVLVGIPFALRQPDGERGRAAAAVVNAFSPVALACAAAIAITGVLAAWIHLGTLSALWASDYGRVLLVKLAAIAIIAAFGAVNWRVLRPAMGDVVAARRIRGSAMTELVIGALVLAVTAVLVATPTPVESARQAPIADRSDAQQTVLP